MFKTINEAITFLVSQGYNEAIARACMNEQYGGDQDGLLFDAGHDLVLQETNSAILCSYNTHSELMVVTPEGIEYDGTLLFDANGNYKFASSL